MAILSFIFFSSLKPVIRPINALERKNILAEVTIVSIVRRFK